MTFVAIATMLAAAPALGQGPGSGAAGAGTAAHPAKPAIAAPPAAAVHAAPAKPAAGSTPESRSAAALALSHEPTYDEGSAQRIRDAALSYSDIAVRGGMAGFTRRCQIHARCCGPHDDLLRQRLLVSGDHPADKSSGPYDDALAKASDAFRRATALPPRAR